MKFLSAPPRNTIGCQLRTLIGFTGCQSVFSRCILAFCTGGRKTLRPLVAEGQRNEIGVSGSYAPAHGIALGRIGKPEKALVAGEKEGFPRHPAACRRDLGSLAAVERDENRPGRRAGLAQPPVSRLNERVEEVGQK